LGRLVRGDVVVVPFPFSDLTQVKRRPALVLAELPGTDVILCPLTTQGTGDPFAIGVDDNDFETGGLRRPSNIRPGRLFTADSSIVLYQAGRLRQQVVQRAIDRAVAVLTRNPDA